jgi:hypothetical protein
MPSTNFEENLLNVRAQFDELSAQRAQFRKCVFAVVAAVNTLMALIGKGAARTMNQIKEATYDAIGKGFETLSPTDVAYILASGGQDSNLSRHDTEPDTEDSNLLILPTSQTPPSAEYPPAGGETAFVPRVVVPGAFRAADFDMFDATPHF